MAEALRKERDVDVQLVDGRHGELTITVNGRTIAEKNGVIPDVAEVVNAVRSATATAA